MIWYLIFTLTFWQRPKPITHAWIEDPNIMWWETVELKRPIDWYGEQVTYLHVLHVNGDTEYCVPVPSKDKNLTEDAWQAATWDRRRT